MPGSSSPTALWPVDKVILMFFTAAVMVILCWWREIPYAPVLLVSHIAGAGLIFAAIAYPNRVSWVFRNWYPVFYVSFCYKEMELLVPAMGLWDADSWLARLDYSVWHTHPTVWLERIQSPALTEYLQIVYTLFVPAVLFVAFLLWRKQRYTEFRYYAFLIALGYLVSYIGYVLVPARGPRFLLRDLQHRSLEGLWLFQLMRGGLDRLESIAYDCFPSGHTELTILAWWSTRHWFNSLFWPYFAYTSSIIFATVYLRYHYTIDVLAGAGVASILLAAAPSLYRRLDGKGA